MVTHAARQLLQDALGLSEEERVRIAAELLSSLDGQPDADWEQAWTAELTRRMKAAESRSEAASKWAEVRERVRARLRPTSTGEGRSAPYSR